MNGGRTHCSGNPLCNKEQQQLYSCTCHGIFERSETEKLSRNNEITLTKFWGLIKEELGLMKHACGVRTPRCP